MSNNRTRLDRGRKSDGADYEQYIETMANGKVYFDNLGAARGSNRYETFVPFNKLTLTSAPTTVAQMYTNNSHFIHTGTATLPTMALSAQGGMNYKSQVTTPADGDTVLVTPVAAATQMYAKLHADSNWRFEAQVSINVTTFMFASFGLNENITDADPTGTAGEGAMFLFDPTREVTTGLTAAQHANWILCHKVDGTDTFTATDIAVNAGQDYELSIVIGPDLKAKFYIDGTLAGTGPALTSGDTVACFCGIELTATPTGQADMDIRYIGLSRNLG